jgi:predicted MFS family arabinose efflux permease
LSPAQSTALAPFRIRNFRLVWPANLIASWAFEMEILILGWYVMVETGSVLLLALFGSLQWAGSLLSPIFGVGGDRLGHRNLLCAMRVFYVVQAAALMALAFTGSLSPLYVFLISTAMSLVRPSDMVMRFALVGEMTPAQHLMSAMSIERMTSDSARVVGALTGAGLIATLGMGLAYVAIAGFYVASLFLTCCVQETRGRSDTSAAAPAIVTGSPWLDLRAAFGYVRRSPLLLAAMCLTFVVNFTAYPLTLGLLPYVAREIYHTDQTGLGYLAASFSLGGLVGSLALAHRGSGIRAGRWMVIFAAVWYVALMAFALTYGMGWGLTMLLIAGCAQSLSLVPMSTVLLRHCATEYRGRVVGIRMFAIYGLAIGLLLSGPLIAAFGFAAMATIYCGVGLVFTAWIVQRWRNELWTADAPANR